MKKVIIVVGTRPNFIKITQFKKVAATLFPDHFDLRVVHTGQHYDHKMAEVFFDQFDLVPDYFLEIPPETPNTQMAEVMLRLEDIIDDFGPELVMVVGDVNSTFAAALTANKMGIRLAHLESGLRSFDRAMPEEINRILTDEITDYFFVTEQSGYDNLLEEGKDEKDIFFVGNTMIDTMVAYESRIQSSSILEKLGLDEGSFALMTMHRPGNVDGSQALEKMIGVIGEITDSLKLVFPIHPRTVKRLKDYRLYGQLEQNGELVLTGPMDYFSFQKLIATCRFVLTDSGGIQEESTFREVPCLTLRPNTERPSTIELGTNLLIPFDREVVREKTREIKNEAYKQSQIPPKWDGKSTGRILKVLQAL